MKGNQRKKPKMKWHHELKMKKVIEVKKSKKENEKRDYTEKLFK